MLYVKSQRVAHGRNEHSITDLLWSEFGKKTTNYWNNILASEIPLESRQML